MRAAEAFALGSSLIWAGIAVLSVPYDLRGLAYVAPTALALWGWRELRAGNMTRAALLLATTLFGLPAVFVLESVEKKRGNEKEGGKKETIGPRPPDERRIAVAALEGRKEGRLKPLTPLPPPPRIYAMPGNGSELVFVPSWVLEAVDLFLSS